jgi:hypothetical protein
MPLGLTHKQAVDFMQHSLDLLTEHHGAEKMRIRRDGATVY